MIRITGEISKPRLLALFLASLFSSLATAQETPAAQSSAAERANAMPASSVEEIVVTARKFVENLQDAPIAISAFSSAGLESRAITNLADISKSTPSLTISNGVVASGTPAAATVFLRGLGQGDFSMFSDPAVGIYLDGVYIARSVGSALDFLDVDRVEVLRGPQGTLFGRNTIGGVINVVSKRPTSEFGGDITATIGRFNRYQLQGSVNVPISDQLRTKFSFYEQKRDGYVYQIPTGTDLNNINAQAGRLQLEFEPNAAFRASLSVDGTHRRENPMGTTALALSGTGFTVDGLPLPAIANNPATVFNRLIGGVCATNPDSSRNCYGAAWLTGNPYQSNGAITDPATLNIVGASLVLEWTIQEGLTLKSITAARSLEAHYTREADLTPLPFAKIHVDDSQDQYSQEFQLNGSGFDNRLKYVLGTYAFKEPAFEEFDNTNLGNGTSQAGIYLHNQNVALFGEGTFDLTHALHLTLGERWTDETKKFSTHQIFVAAPNPALVGRLLVADTSEKTVEFRQFTPRAILSADLAPGLLAYVTYSKGFKSGGFNGRYTSFVPAPIPFNPEFVTLYEGGLKFSSPDRKFRLNTALFDMDYKDIQVTYRPDPSQTVAVVGNAAAAKIKGAEAEATWIPMAGLTFEAGLSYLDAYYTSLGAGVPSGPGGINLYTPFQLTSKWQGNLSASYDIRLPNNWGSLTPRIDGNARSKFSTDSIDSPTIRQSAYTLLNANISYVPASGDWRVSAGVTNLTDKQYLVGGLFTSAAGNAAVVYGRPREWYLSAKYNF